MLTDFPVGKPREQAATSEYLGQNNITEMVKNGSKMPDNSGKICFTVVSDKIDSQSLNSLLNYESDLYKSGPLLVTKLL